MSDETPLNDEEVDAAFAEYEEQRDELFEMISEFADDNDLDDGMLAALLLDLAVSVRMLAYANSVEKPSVQGLRLEMDRFKKDADEHARSAKQEAETFIADVKAQREAAEAEGGEE